MNVVRHDHPSEVDTSALLLEALQRRHRECRQIGVIEESLTAVSDRGDRVDIPGLRPTTFQETWAGHA
ncbi:hypothetical protein G6F57_013547 [Rhizopus arrhizus]|uniref:hypothetical protein n=1 Tax=Stenotrophomonas sp. GD03930 TaxID=2975406 RepID=UPI0027B96933|nr:hypothetical protein [Stenotrophomonas maltophilia]KAG0747229.1 hypothetical protein G6F24_015582 [Rhizopus arrhizus]KAG0930483.1 hypothetical protein G6F31_017024 [Rhizopus arrhizus]KAG1464570.1 hypothetical protein G6F57_013547 [Rhizopus arrhizus]KAG1581492.1 hypothetical protein G6F46_015352 [Rhizopus delemar]